MLDVAEIVRSVRRHADVSQRQLASLAKVSPSTVARIETGAADPSFAIVDRLLRAVDCRLLVLGQDRAPVPVLVDGALRDGQGRRYPAHLDVQLRVGWEHGVHPPARTRFPRAFYFLDRRLRDRRRAAGYLDVREAAIRGVPAHPPPRVGGHRPRRLRPHPK